VGTGATSQTGQGGSADDTLYGRGMRASVFFFFVSSLRLPRGLSLHSTYRVALQHSGHILALGRNVFLVSRMA